MTEKDRIRNAWMSVSTLATNSEYYDIDIDDHDINLIAKYKEHILTDEEKDLVKENAMNG